MKKPFVSVFVIAPILLAVTVFAGEGKAVIVKSVKGPVVKVVVTPQPPRIGKNMLDITVTDADGKLLTNLKGTAAVVSTDMDMGTGTPAVVLRKDGHYTAEVDFNMAGNWRVTLTFMAGKKTKATGSFKFKVGSM